MRFSWKKNYGLKKKEKTSDEIWRRKATNWWDEIGKIDAGKDRAGNCLEGKDQYEQQ